jgi:uroporphyrinogen decarboxylase
MEGAIWPELMDYFRENLGLVDADAAQEYLDTDFRWFSPAYVGPEPDAEEVARTAPLWGTYSDHVMERKLRDAQTVVDLDRYTWPKPTWWDGSAVRAFRETHPDRAVVLCCGWMPLFCTGCSVFGIEEALVKMVTAPELFSAFVERQNEFYLGLLERCCKLAEGVADICWLGDDYATQRALMMSPELWRRYFKEPMRQQAEVAHRYGMPTLFHSCGSVRAILPDLIEIGIRGLLTFQTSAEGMDAASIARDFGGKLVFYGGMDVQQLLTFGSEQDVRREVRKNIDLFADCGGYIVANSHHCIANIKPRNMVAMLTEARSYRPTGRK